MGSKPRKLTKKQVKVLEAYIHRRIGMAFSDLALHHFRECNKLKYADAVQVKKNGDVVIDLKKLNKRK